MEVFCVLVWLPKKRKTVGRDGIQAQTNCFVGGKTNKNRVCDPHVLTMLFVLGRSHKFLKGPEMGIRLHLK